MRTIVSAVQAVLITVLAIACGQPADDESSPALPAQATAAASEAVQAEPVIDKERRSVAYALNCADGAEPKLTLTDRKTLVLACPEPGGRRLKVACPEGVEITKVGGHFDFECR